jgi:hypothetical protein
MLSLNVIVIVKDDMALNLNIKIMMSQDRRGYLHLRKLFSFVLFIYRDRSPRVGVVFVV